MTFRQVDHQHVCILKFTVLHLDKRLFYRLRRHILPAVIECFQITCQQIRLRHFLCLQKLQGTLCCIQSSTGIHTRTDHKSNVIWRQLIYIHTSTSHQRLQSQILRPFQHIQSLFNENTVFVHQIHNITNRCDCHIFHQIICIFRIFSHGFHQSLHQLVSNRSPAQPFERISTVLLLRIHNRICLRQNISSSRTNFRIRDLMMIRHHNRHSHTFCIGDLLCRRNPVITGNDRIHVGLQRPVDQVPVQTIPVLHTIWNVTVHISSEHPESLQKNIGRLDSINIIVSDDPDFCIFFYLFSKNRYCLVHILHQHSIVQIGDRTD